MALHKGGRAAAADIVCKQGLNWQEPEDPEASKGIMPQTVDEEKEG